MTKYYPQYLVAIEVLYSSFPELLVNDSSDIEELMMTRPRTSNEAVNIMPKYPLAGMQPLPHYYVLK